jgi:D-lactate dehydrogenase (cytochrome)
MNAPLPGHTLPAFAHRLVPPAMLKALEGRFAQRCSTAQAVREQHGRDESPFDVTPPDVVVFAQSTEDVAFVVKLANEHEVPVIPFGVGSSLEGHLLAVQGGVSIDLSGMNQVVAVHAEDLTVTVQAGVTRTQLNREIKDTGLFFPIDPGADATLGGMAATRASGTNAVRYGTMRENVLALTVVTAQGEILRTGTRARKSSAGYDLTRLFVGSEGTLGVMTEVTLRLYPFPEAISAAVCHFPTVEAAVKTTIALIQLGVPIARCELLDANAVRAVNAHAKLALLEQPMLLMEFHGSPTGVQEQAAVVQEIAREHGGQQFEWATTPEERTRLWTARHHAYFAGMQSHPGCRTVTTDTCVPISRLADCVTQALAEAAQAGVAHYTVGHVGDGNFHVAYLINPAHPGERDAAEALNETLVRRALRAEGTCTGEHGVGLHKQGFLVEEAGAGAVEMMRTIKHALDPKNIMNPGKIFPF